MQEQEKCNLQNKSDGLRVPFLHKAIATISHQASGGFGLELVCCLHFGLSFAIAIGSLNSLEMPVLASAFSSVLPHVICGQPTGRECATQLVSKGLWAYGPRGQPNEEADCDTSCRCQEDSNDEKDSR